MAKKKVNPPIVKKTARQKGPTRNNKGKIGHKGNTSTEPKVWTDEEIIEALRQNEGVVQAAAEALGCCKATIYERSRRNPVVKEVMKKYRKNLIDVATGGLLRHLKDPDSKNNFKAVAFTLETLGRNRGFVKRTEQRHGGDENAPPIKTQNFWDDIPLELRKQVLEAKRKAKQEQEDSDGT